MALGAETAKGKLLTSGVLDELGGRVVLFAVPAEEYVEIEYRLDLKRAGKIRHYGVALGPKIGWRDEGVRALEERPITSLQTVYNMLEQEPGAEFLAVATERGAGIIARVPTSSGLLEGHLTPEHTFAGNSLGP